MRLEFTGGEAWGITTVREAVEEIMANPCSQGLP